MAETKTSSDLRPIPTERIITNELNPRGPNVRENDPEFGKLRESIRQLGILVPLVVHPIEKDGEVEYLLIDGERRYHAAHSLRMKEVPAYLISAPWDDEQIQLVMFHVHMNQRQWDASQQCHATEWLYKSLLQEYGDPFSKKIIKEYTSKTGAVGRTARNRIQFLRWPEEIKNKIYSREHDAYWYVVEIEDKIIEPAISNYPEYFDKVSVDEVREFLFRKLEEGKISKAVEVRPASVITKSNVKEPDKRAEVLQIFDNLVTDTNYSFAEAAESFERRFPEASQPTPMSPQRLTNAIDKLADQIIEYDEEYLEEATPRTKVDRSELIQSLEELISAAGDFISRIRGE